jgi:hypothetical protein
MQLWDSYKYNGLFNNVNVRNNFRMKNAFFYVRH